MTGTQIVDRAADRAEDRAGHRLVWIFVVVSCAGLVALTVAFFAYRADTSGEIDSLRGQVDDNAAVAQTLAGQVRDLGGEPVVEPPRVGAPGEDGVDGADGLNGSNGQDGSDGRDGRDGRAGADGSDGRDGVAGADGRDGTDGANGQSGEPPCMSEPAQCRGADGQDGEQGPPGPPGPTCPDGYAAQSRTWDPTPLVPGDEETWWVCVANGGQE